MDGADDLRMVATYLAETSLKDRHLVKHKRMEPALVKVDFATKVWPEKPNFSHQKRLQPLLLANQTRAWNHRRKKSLPLEIYRCQSLIFEPLLFARTDAA